MYRVRLGNRARKDLDRLRGQTWERVRDAIRSLETDPRPHGCTKLQIAHAYRIRIGDYRVIYDVDDEERIVTILRATHRREAYRGL